MDRCSSSEEQVIEKAIKDFPIQMQEVIRHMLIYVKMKDKREMRYTKRWMLESILLSIKSKKAYLHLRSHNILPLPTLTTLKKYLKNLKPECGFDPHVFRMLKKSDAMKPEEKRGKILYHFSLKCQ